mmetsp:Transcript_82501/g.120879  ORF Transcript_82501/g.120879 Transcript_82501/m.120879 type:complete len:111 (-) Transcript_82501:76-408(-)
MFHQTASSDLVYSSGSQAEMALAQIWHGPDDVGVLFSGKWKVGKWWCGALGMDVRLTQHEVGMHSNCHSASNLVKNAAAALMRYYCLKNTCLYCWCCWCRGAYPSLQMSY